VQGLLPRRPGEERLAVDDRAQEDVQHHVVVVRRLSQDFFFFANPKKTELEMKRNCCKRKTKEQETGPLSRKIEPFDFVSVIRKQKSCQKAGSRRMLLDLVINGKKEINFFELKFL
jgi:hypothetical protein